MRGVSIALIILFLTTPVAEALNVPADPIVHGAIEGYLRPGFHALAEEAARFETTVNALCIAPSAPELAATRNEFKATALAYAHVEFARLGPLGVGDRADRLLFWPDPKGIALRQVQAALASVDSSVLDPAQLRAKSVAMQGLVAGEYLLFGTGSEALATTTPDGTFRCGYLRSIAMLVGPLTRTIDAEWQDGSATGFVAQMNAPSPTAATLRTTDEVVQQIVQVLTFGNDSIRDQRVTPILGAAQGAPRPKSALFWRSGLTASFLGADFAGLRTLFEQANFPDALAGLGLAPAVDSTRFEFDTAAKAASAITSPIDVAVADTLQLAQLRELRFVTQSLDSLLGEKLPDALGLAGTFSLLDGD